MTITGSSDLLCCQSTSAKGSSRGPKLPRAALGSLPAWSPSRGLVLAQEAQDTARALQGLGWRGAAGSSLEPHMVSVCACVCVYMCMCVSVCVPVCVWREAPRGPLTTGSVPPVWWQPARWAGGECRARGMWRRRLPRFSLGPPGTCQHVPIPIAGHGLLAREAGQLTSFPSLSPPTHRLFSLEFPNTRLDPNARVILISVSCCAHH